MPETLHTSSQYYNLPTPVHLYVRFSFPLRDVEFSSLKGRLPAVEVELSSLGERLPGFRKNARGQKTCSGRNSRLDCGLYIVVCVAAVGPITILLPRKLTHTRT